MKNYNLIRARETDLKITQEEFAKRLSMSKDAYNLKENGKRKIWINEANKIIDMLNQIAKEKGLNKQFDYNDIFLN